MFAKVLRFAQDNVVLVSLVAAALVVVIAMVVLMVNKQTCPKCECQKCECPTPRCPQVELPRASASGREKELVYEDEYSDDESDEDEGDDFSDYSDEDDDDDEDFENEIEGYSNFTNKKNGRCPKGTVEITSGGHKGECYKGGKSSSNSGGKRKSGGKRDNRPEAGKYLSGSKFRYTVGGECPSGTVKITSGKRKGQCVINDGGYKYWGWGQHAGLKCRNPDNSGCDTSQGYSKPRAVDYRYWGWGPNAGMKCRNKDNTGCDTSYAYTRG